MTNQLLLGIAVVAVALLIAYELIETWRWQGFENRPPSRFRVVRGVRGAIGGLVSIVTLRRWRRPKPEPPMTLTDDDLARRLGDAPSGPIHIQPGRIVVSGARVAPAPQPVQPVVPLPQPSAPAPSRLRLARDMVGAALVMGGFVLVFANVMPQISGPVRPDGAVLDVTATPVPTVEIRTAVPQTAAPSADAIASADPGAPPSASPDGTGLVSAEPTPTASVKPKPAAQPQPTAAPIIPPTTAPTPRPTPKPTKRPTPTPKPAAHITAFGASPASAAINEVVTFSYSFTHATGCVISFDDGSGTQSCSASGDGSNSITHSFDAASTYHVVLTIDGAGGSDTQPVTVVVADAAP